MDKCRPQENDMMTMRDPSGLSCYYIAKIDTVLSRISGVCDVNVSTLHLGMLVQVNEVQPDGGLRIRVIDTISYDDVWQKTEWRCHKKDLIPVSTIVWYFLAAVSAPQERVDLASDQRLCQEVTKNFKQGKRVWYQPAAATVALAAAAPEAAAAPLSAVAIKRTPTPSIGEKKSLALIRWIGPVPELGQGFYLGLELLESQESTQTSILARKNIGNLTLATLGEVRPLDQLEPLLSDELKNCEPIKSSTMEKVALPNEYYFDAFPSSNNHTTNGKRIQSDYTVAYDDRFNIFDDRNNNNPNNNSNNNGDTMANLSDALIPKVAHKSATSKIVIPNDDASSLISKNHDSFDFLEGPIEKKHQNEERKDVRIGCTVQVGLGNETRYGLVRWIGTPPGITPGETMAAIELEDGQHSLGTDGTFNDVRYFHCRPHRAVFVDLKHCQPFFNMSLADDHLYKLNGTDFGTTENSVVTGMVRPISVKGHLESICGKYRGIQGHHNSCYLDSTLFSMFAFTSVFDHLLFRPPNEKDCPQYEQVQRVLREEIVNPLRKNMFVKADRVMKLRMLLEKLSSVSGLTSEEKDPEEFLTSLVAQILNAEPFLKLSSGQDAYHYQLFVEKDHHLSFPTVQQLLEQSFFTSNIRLEEVPSILIIQMPRFGKSFKMYQKIQPTLLLDVTDIIEDSPRQCTVCGKLAEFECKECYGECGVGLESIAFCAHCLDKVHRHERRTNHEAKKLDIPTEFIILQEHCPVPRLYLELSAVVCIETSHYVSFVKCGSGSEAPWCFFDSMADRKGEQNGYNIPEMVPCPDFPYWLSEEGANSLTELTDDRQLPEHAKRLLCDAYMCMYQSSDIMMYK